MTLPKGGRKRNARIMLELRANWTSSKTLYAATKRKGTRERNKGYVLVMWKSRTQTI